MSEKVITVVGATGQQGKGVIAAFINGPYHIRGITRNPGSTAAKALEAQGVEVIKADLGDLGSLKAAFDGSHFIYSVTDYYGPFERYGPERAREIEYEHGVNLAKAAAATSTLEHYVWSTLSRTSKEYPVPHFDSKYDVEKFIRADPALLAKTTSFCPQYIASAKKYVQFTTHRPDTPVPLIGDASVNVSPFIKAIVEQAAKTRDGAVVIGSAETLSAEEWIQTWAKAKGVELQTVHVTREVYDSLWPWPVWAEEFAKMFAYFVNVPMTEWVEPGATILTKEEHGLTDFQYFKDWVKDYKLPDFKKIRIASGSAAPSCAKYHSTT